MVVAMFVDKLFVGAGGMFVLGREGAGGCAGDGTNDAVAMDVAGAACCGAAGGAKVATGGGSAEARRAGGGAMPPLELR